MIFVAFLDTTETAIPIAVKKGGVDDQRRINLNLEILEGKGSYNVEVLEGVRKLFQARNSARKLGADSMAEDDAAAFVSTAKALAKVFSE
jgi:hypothetical protein